MFRRYEAVLLVSTEILLTRPNQPQQAIDEPGRLPERHAEQNLHRQAGLNSSVTVGLLTATPACRHGIPVHLGVEPDRQRAAALERFVIGWPVPGRVGRWCRSAHPCQLPRWIHKMNPTRDLCNRAGQRPLISKRSYKAVISGTIISPAMKLNFISSP